MPRWILGLVAASAAWAVACKARRTDTADVKAVDHLAPDYAGKIPVAAGTTQFPAKAQCLAALVPDPAAAASTLVDLAWQFPQAKSQRYGDCYVYAGVAGLEAAMNRVYLRKPQLALSEPFVALGLLTSPDSFDQMKRRLLRPIVDSPSGTPGEFTDQLVTGGSGDSVIGWALKNVDALLLSGEFRYEDAEAALDGIRQGLLAQKSLDLVRYGDLAAIFAKAKAAVGFETAQMLTDFQEVIARKQIDKLDLTTLRKAGLRYRTSALGRDAQAAFDSLGAAKQEFLFENVFADVDESLAWDKLGDKLADAYDKALPVDPDPLAVGEEAIAAAKAKAEADSKVRAEAAAPLIAAARQACDDGSKKVQQKIAEYLCQGIPVVVGVHLIGTEIGKEIAPPAADPEDPAAVLAAPAQRRAAGPTKLEPWWPFMSGLHSKHAMAIDGAVRAADGSLKWRLRNSWGGVGSAYFPVAETCRIFIGSAVVLPGEPQEAMKLLGTARR